MNAFHNTAVNGPRELDLQRASDFHATLLGMAGHDLRQPLQVIQSAYEWLGGKVAGHADKSRLRRGERAIERLTEQLDRLVSALRLYEYTKHMQLTRAPLAPLLWRIADENTDAALEKGIDLCVVPTRAVVWSNPMLLDGILRNLVRNAVKYTEPGGRVLVGCRKSGADVRIDVYDTGIGIPEEHLPRIFAAFHRVNANRTDGLGIGLFVVRRAVELLEHRIEVSSKEGCGSRFSVLARAVAPEDRTA